MFNFRIVSADFYMNSPVRGLDVTYSKFRLFPVKHVPVIRVFGVTPEGIKSCIHVHGVFPYMYIPYDGGGNPNILMSKIAQEIDDGINQTSINVNNSQKQHVFKMSLVSGIPFYGFHTKCHQFFKIYFYHPASIKKALTLFEQGGICGKVFQPYEAHVPYILQFFIDYNLYGMSYLKLSSYTLRREIIQGSQSSTNLEKISHCELEGDTIADCIMNKISRDSGEDNLNPGLAAIWEEERARMSKEGQDLASMNKLSQTLHSSQPTLSDFNFRNELISAIEKRLQETGQTSSQVGYPVETPEDAALPDSSMIDNHNLSAVNLLTPPAQGRETLYEEIFDSQDIQLMRTIEELMDVNAEREHAADEDSILGSQAVEDDDPVEVHDEDLTLPLSPTYSPEMGGNEDAVPECPDGNNESDYNIWEDSYWSGCVNLSQFDQAAQTSGSIIESDDNIEYTDGNFDSSSSDESESMDNLFSTPKKRTKRLSQGSPDPRYKKLNISFQKSPTLGAKRTPEKFTPTKRKSGSIDPKLLEELQKNASVINEKLKSPKLSQPNLREVHPSVSPPKSAPPFCNTTVPDKIAPQKTSKIVAFSDDIKISNEDKKVDSKKGKRILKGDSERRKRKNSLRIKVLTSSQSSDPDEFFNQQMKRDSKGNASPLKVTESNIDSESRQVVSNAGSSSARKILFPVSEEDPSDSSQLSNCLVSINKDSENDSELSFIAGSDSDCSQDLGVVSFYEKTITSPNVTLVSSKGSLLTPAMLPPTRSDVMRNLNVYGLREEKDLEPFYGNLKDSSSSKEVGFDVVKLPGRFASDLEEFTGSFGNYLKNTRSLLIKSCLGASVNVDVSQLLPFQRGQLITLRSPPSRKDAEDWLRKSKTADEKSKPKDVPKEQVGLVFLGGSPNESVSEFSLTPCTPTIVGTPEFETAEKEFPSTSCVPGFKLRNQSTPLVGNTLSPSMSNCSKSNSGSCSTPNEAVKLVSEASPVTPIPSTSRGPLSTIKEGEESNFSDCSSSAKASPLLTTQLEVKSVVCEVGSLTPNNSGMFKMELQNLQDAHSISTHKHVTLLSAEVHVHTRGDFKPDPEHDAILAFFYSIFNDVPHSCSKSQFISGAIIWREGKEPKRRYTLNCKITFVDSELELIKEITSLVRKHDPDMIAGYEIEMLSWGYIIQRGFILGLNLLVDLSRVSTVPFYQPDVNLERGMDVKVSGRIVLNVWRLMRHEVALMSYSFENIAYHVLHTRVPHFSFKTLTGWWTHRCPHYREYVLNHYITRVVGIFLILDQLDFIGSTSELASLFGIQFYEVLSRGSQFRVESMMLRQAKLWNYVPVSPSVKQRAHMRAPACLPLVMEPKSRFYADPVIVLDFQSLYPSMIIAYNYCFSTCLGRVENLTHLERFEFGCTELKVPLQTLAALKNKIHVSPAGVAFVTTEVRKGVLPKMLEEILETRLMVKKSMKEHKSDKLLQRVLHARQLGLKLIANVTYGYTSANFSGRMPCMEVGDSVVSKGRETLERVIAMVNSNEKWGAKVVYGDTDSLFVLCPGKTRRQAFEIGQEIADRATAENPHPVKLKLEKVYQPCILQTKKRYVGFMYESPDQKEPSYDAKGIETVRRDGCPAVSKILEKSLRLLFKTKDVSQVKQYVCRQMSKIFTGRVSVQDLTFAKEYRGLHGYKPGACVPSLKIARERLEIDRRDEPRSGERVGYVIVCGQPGLPLIKLTKAPYQLIKDPSLRINAEYYILKAILPPLDRCFSLLGANVFNWYNEFPKKQYQRIGSHMPTSGPKKITITQYFVSMMCVICGEMTTEGVCFECQTKPHLVAALLSQKSRNLEQRNIDLLKLCESCCGRKMGLDCISLDCPVLYRRAQTTWDLKQNEFLDELKEKYTSNLF